MRNYQTAEARQQHEQGVPVVSRHGDLTYLALLLLLLLAFALRIFMLDAQSIWWDEGISLHLASSSISDIFADRVNNIHPPLYFILLKGWIALTGLSTFSARYFSVLAGWLQVAAVFAVAARWYRRQGALLSAAIAAVSAVSVIYAQEIRVYALLPLAYLALLAITGELTQPRTGDESGSWSAWAALALISWIALHLHYVAFFAVAYVTLWALLSFALGRRWAAFRRTLFVQLLMALASLPWFLAALGNWRAIAGEANAGTFIAESVPGTFLIKQVWTFHLTGLPGMLGRQGFVLLAGAAVIGLALLVLVRLISRVTRRETAVLLAHWLVPLSGALIVWLVRSFSHPRYVAMFVPGLILLCGYVILPGPVAGLSRALNRAARALSLFLALALFGSSLWALSLYFFDESVAKDNVRAVAQLLQQTAEEDDLILVPDTDWSLPFEYQGQGTIAMPGLDQQGAFWSNMARLTASSPETFLLDYQRGTRDWQQAARFALHKAGYQTGQTAVGELLLRSYVLTEPVSEADLSAVDARYGPLLLQGVWVEQGAPAGDAIAVALEWQASGANELVDGQVALQLLDGDRREIASRDDRLLDNQGRPTQFWPEGEHIVTYHLLPVAHGTPPLAYDLGIQLYQVSADTAQPLDLLDESGAPQGQTFILPGIETGRSVNQPDLSSERLPNSILAEAVEVAPGLVLDDAALSNSAAAAGTPLFVTLRWLAVAEPGDLRPGLQLMQDEDLLASNEMAPAGGRYPTTEWQPGEYVQEVRTITLPAGSSGRAQLLLTLGDGQFHLAEVEITPQRQLFTEPVTDWPVDTWFGDIGRLTGVNLSQTIFDPSDKIPLELVWEAGANESRGDYVVFTHIISADGRLVGQHDGVPAYGRRPVGAWVEGEFIRDLHDLGFRDPQYQGLATIAIGLYDPVSGERVLTADGSDHIALPLVLRIEAAEE